MSFGFSKEMPDISRAIWQAVLDTNHAILFFAAARNDGGNGGEMFPANPSLVISIRGTDSQGYFLNFNPPPNRHETVVYGTLLPTCHLLGCVIIPGKCTSQEHLWQLPLPQEYISGKPPGTVEVF
jgi:hypothetical protein